MAVLWLGGLSVGAIALPLVWTPIEVDAANPATAPTPIPDVVIRDPAQIVGPNACAECHTNEHQVWMGTAHQANARALTRNAEARRIAKAMGVRRLKTDKRCATCHFTVQQVEGKRPKSISGVSCESCHSAGAGWIAPHSQFGDGAESARDETAQHRVKRYQYCESMGMIHPARLYELASACFSCHTIHDRELIEVGGHPTGEGFEMVSWSQGDMRHNFIREGADNNPMSSPERRRVMHLVSATVRLEYALRAADSENPNDALIGAIENLESINTAAKLDSIGRLIEIGKGFGSAGNSDRAERIERVRAIGQAIVTENIGADVVGIDELIPAIKTRERQ